MCRCSCSGWGSPATPFNGGALVEVRMLGRAGGCGRRPVCLRRGGVVGEPFIGQVGPQAGGGAAGGAWFRVVDFARDKAAAAMLT
jgi:hypothetical protein